MDIFQKFISPKRTKFARDFRNFNKREFAEEIGNIDWPDAIDVSNGIELSYQSFYMKIENILDVIASLWIKTMDHPWATCFNECTG